MSEATVEDGPSLFLRALMSNDEILANRVGAALAGKALRVAAAGRPAADATSPAVHEWAYARSVMSPPAEEVSRALWAISALLDGPAWAYSDVGSEEAVTDEAIIDAVDAVWSSLAGA